MTQLVVLCFKIRPTNRNNRIHQTSNALMKYVGKDVIILTKNVISKKNSGKSFTHMQLCSFTVIGWELVLAYMIKHDWLIVAQIYNFHKKNTLQTIFK
jgi:hypothetical protein